MHTPTRYAAPLAATAVLVLAAGPAFADTASGHTAVAGPADPADPVVAPLTAPGGATPGTPPVYGPTFGSEPGTSSTPSSSLPAGGLAAALLVAGAGTVLATRAMCSGRGWR